MKTGPLAEALSPKWGRTKPTIQFDERYHKIHRLGHSDNEVLERHKAVIG